MARDYLNNVVGRGYGPAEHGQPGHDYGKPTSADAHIKYFNYVLVLETLTPEERERVGLGDFTQQEWDAWKARIE